MSEILLGVNVDHVATLRQARGTVYPDLVKAALEAEAGGADGITVHLREDRRHIQDADVFALKESIQTRLNLEMAATNEMLSIAKQVKPAYCCIVPEKREELTTEGGLNVAGQLETIKRLVGELSDAGVLVSLFIDPDAAQIDATVQCGAPYIEIHTGAYADAGNSQLMSEELQRIQIAAQYASEQGIIVNAGHGLTVDNVVDIAKIPQMFELNIGHSIVADAVFLGIKEAVALMKRTMLEA